MTSYILTPDAEGLAIEISEVGDKQEQLMTAFGECAAGQCSCPTDQYRKVEAIEVVPDDATRRASRVLPTPPTPVSVTSRCVVCRTASSASS